MAQNINPDSVAVSVASNSKPQSNSSSGTGEKHSVTKRLQQELMALMRNSVPGISAFPDGENLFTWIGTIVGGKQTMYEDLKYKLSLEFPPSYPYSAPTVKFVSPCFHPNIDPLGNICLDILKEKWSALYDVRTILLSVQSLLSEPNPASPLNADAAELWKHPQAYRKAVLDHYNTHVLSK